MIFWISKPGPVFRVVLKDAFSYTLDLISIFDGESLPVLPGVFDDEEIAMFGGAVGLRRHLVLLSSISADQDRVFQVSDYSYLVLDRVLSFYCRIHNDTLDDFPDCAGLKVRGHRIGHLNFERFFLEYFWDNDYDFPDDWFNQASFGDKQAAGFNEEAFGVINRMMPHPDEILPRQVNLNVHTWDRTSLYRTYSPIPLPEFA